MTLVSVVMPVLNSARWLNEAIRSILDQTHRELELIVVDDGSTDESAAIGARAAAADSRVRTILLEPAPDSTSSARAANAGINQAAGSYVARMDGDDIALPHRIERELAFLEARRLDACGGLAQAFGSEERFYWYPESQAGVGRELLFRVGILHPTLLARAELMRAHPYAEAASHEDYEWQVRIYAAGARLGNLQELVLRHRTHAGQAHVRHARLFLEDLRRYRFQHLMRLFPKTRPHEYQVLAAIAEKLVIVEEDDLRSAAAWLARLADVHEVEVEPAMSYRWRQLCERSGLSGDDPLRDLYAQALEQRRAA